MDIQGIDLNRISYNRMYYIHDKRSLLVELKFIGDRYIVVDELHGEKAVEVVCLVSKFLSEYSVVGMGAAVIKQYHEDAKKNEGV